MRRVLFANLMILSVVLLALAACSRIQENNNPPSSPPATPAPASPAPASPAPASPAPASQASPAATGFLVPSALEGSLAHEQYQFLSAAPASDYDSTDNASITITCQSTGTDTFTCTGTDSDGDVGSPDNVTVAADGSSWSDSGMTWSGPDVTPSGGGGFAVAPVTNWTGS
jgi:hypothetical protein